jgi:hypothetical protein
MQSKTISIILLLVFLCGCTLAQTNKNITVVEFSNNISVEETIIQHYLENITNNITNITWSNITNGTINKSIK